MAEKDKLLPDSIIPDKGLLMFYRITLWREMNKGKKIKVRSWKKVQKRIKGIDFKKTGNKNNLGVPKILPQNALYLPQQYDGKDVMRELRNAFCHNAISYNSLSGQYEIKSNKDVHIAGSFSIDALQELIEAILID